ncbi:extracellular solute-binding protein [Herbaspirillum rubrisubalbicans]|uniref:extracellular solute-binding protein n=1 Tax=Herbaspirillum rubrisubalbicans TaxID=80842 RepID=UPI001558A6E9|nr:glycerol-3-phosphate ABC transporter substrate-binding protein [Herbaspirillum rubrisubalbicans]
MKTLRIPRRPCNRTSLLLLALGLCLLLATPRAPAANFEFWSSHAGATAAAVRQLCAGFNAAQHQHHVRCVIPGTYEQTMQKTIAAYRAGQQPALVEIYDVGTLDMMLSGAIVPVHQLMAEHDLVVDWQDYLPAIRSYYTDAQGQFDSLPFNVSTAVLYLNTDQLRRAGVSTLPATWGELEQAARQLRAAGQTCPLVSDFNPWIMLEQVSTIEGAPIADQDNGHQALSRHYLFDQGLHLRFMQEVLRWYRQHLLVQGAATRAGGHTLAFTTGECAMLLDSSSAWDAVAKSGLKNVAVRPLPIHADSTRHNSVPGGASLWVMKGFSREVYAAVAAFIAYLQQPQNQLMLVRQTGYLPVTRQVAAQIMDDASGYPPSVVAGIHSLDTAARQCGVGPRLGFFPQLRLAWTEQVQTALAGEQDMGQALSRARQRGDGLLQRFRRTYAAPVSP